jgi:uncharacterized membrane protein YbhN (UPF0104 family)
LVGGLVAVSAAGRQVLRRIVGALPAVVPVEKREKLLAALENLTDNRPRLAGAVTLSFATHALSIASYLVTLRAVGLSGALLPMIALYAVTSVIVTVPLTISGVGLRDWFTVLYFEALGWPAGAGLAFTWVSLASTFCFACAGGLVQLWELFHARRARNP